MYTWSSFTRSLQELKSKLDYVNQAWSSTNYERLLRFYVRVIPALLDAERCSIFIVDPSHGGVVSKLGTGLTEAEIEAPIEGSIVGRAISTAATMLENDVTAQPGFHHTSDARTGFVTRSVLCVPVHEVNGGRVIGAVEVLNKAGERGFAGEDQGLLTEIAEYLSIALDNVLLSGEMHRLSHELNREVSRFQVDYLGEVPLIAESDGMRRALELVQMVCDTPVNVLLQGENGTGKEVIARMIHEGRARRGMPFVPVNCAAIPENLMESEFFGYEKGAFTGAVASRRGRFEEAAGGTLFLDEVADVPLSMQPKFLRAIQEREGTRLGTNRIVRYDFSLISATNRNLREAVAAGRFREDLFYRLFAVEIVIPPLRERKEDIAALTVVFLEEVAAQFDKPLGPIANELISLFEGYAWPGNVRQLRREVERLVALTPRGQPLTPDRCSADIVASANVGRDERSDLSLPRRVRELEVDLIKRALTQTEGSKGRASDLLRITRQGLHKKLKRYGITAV